MTKSRLPFTKKFAGANTWTYLVYCAIPCYITPSRDMPCRHIPCCSLNWNTHTVLYHKLFIVCYVVRVTGSEWSVLLCRIESVIDLPFKLANNQLFSLTKKNARYSMLQMKWKNICCFLLPLDTKSWRHRSMFNWSKNWGMTHDWQSISDLLKMSNFV